MERVLSYSSSRGCLTHVWVAFVGTPVGGVREYINLVEAGDLVRVLWACEVVPVEVDLRQQKAAAGDVRGDGFGAPR